MTNHADSADHIDIEPLLERPDPSNQAAADRMLGTLVRTRSIEALDRVLLQLWRADAVAGLVIGLDAAETMGAVREPAAALRRQGDSLMTGLHTAEQIFDELNHFRGLAPLLAGGDTSQPR